ncbi:hypothetical protein ACQ86N_21310 [Puia sp. P3]|uniref:hypothetical protein n=1 Tax=Puia sp. P3 TaxID=3423952 RepID=UPI003D6732A8
MQTKHFAVLELNIAESRFLQLGEAKVAVGKYTVDKYDSRKVGLLEIAAGKFLFFVFFPVELFHA